MNDLFFKKLRITAGMRLLAIDAPENFRSAIQTIPGDVTISDSPDHFDQIHWFVKTIGQLKLRLTEVTNLLPDDKIAWIYFPKGSSGIQTDLTRDSALQQVNTIAGIQWLSLVSFDATWSAFAIRLKKDNTRIVKTQTETDFVDTVNRVIRLPPDLRAAIETGPGLLPYFEKLSFTERKEYVLSVVLAKKEETRQRRIAKIVGQIREKSEKVSKS